MRTWRRSYPQVGDAIRTEKALSKANEAALRERSRSTRRWRRPPPPADPRHTDA